MPDIIDHDVTLQIVFKQTDKHSVRIEDVRWGNDSILCGMSQQSIADLEMEIEEKL